ncbi:MAG: alpha/beta hydrolase [Planctomycetia bacterium]|nr:alpha/beta hydrolase [Planctomycetia bacterium]
MRRFLCVLAFGVALLSSRIGASTEPAPPVPPLKADKPNTPAPRLLEVKLERNIVYDTIDGQKLYLDLAMPKAKGKYPCVVMFHGGAWRTGTRKDLSIGNKGKDGKLLPSLIEEVASRGYIVVAVSYRLAPKYKFPAQMQDARASVRFLRANAKQYGIDPDKFAAAGFSAGAHLALLLGMANKVDGWDAGNNTDHSSKVQCVVDFFGPTDLSLYTTSPALEDAYLVPVFGKDVKTDPKIYQKASPITYASKNAPPTLILHGTFDLIVPIIHSENLLKKLREEKATVEMISVRGEGHGWSGLALTRTFNDAIKFLDTHLKGKK